MLKAFLPFVVVATFVSLAPAQSGKSSAGASPEHIFSDERLLPNYPLVARVIIREITDPNAKTNGTPPRLNVEIVELVSGTVKETTIRAVWRPFPHDVDYGVPEKNPRVLKWKEMPNPAPAVKSVWLLAGQLRDGVFEIAPRCRYPFTDEKLAWVRKAVVEGKRKRKEAEEKAANELKDAITADQAIQRKADFKNLWETASDVVIGKRASEGIGPNYYNLTLVVEQRLKDARADKDPKQTSVEVSVSKPATPMVHNRLYLYRDKPPTYVAFITVVPGENSQGPLATVDKRRFEFIDRDNGLVLLTDDVLQELQKLGKAKKEAKPAP